MEQKSQKSHYFLEPGSIFACWEPYTLATVLGSCVAVCLCDTISKVAGMNHFVFPKHFGHQSPIKCGSHSIPQLLKMVTEMGANKKNLEAHIIGGSFSGEYASKDIGKKNIEMAKKILAKYKIPIVNEDTGGTFGRKVVFNTNSGEIIVCKVKSIREQDWYDDKSISNR